MPRSAATILGLVLVAFSIGFNTVRYPEVWEMVNPVRANESLQPAAASPPEQPASAPPQLSVSPASPPAKPIEVKPTPEVVERVVVHQPVSADAKRASGNEAATAEQEARKPLVPVAPGSVSGSPGNGVADGAGIRRLPPIDPNLASRGPTPSLGGSIPIYPTTGIE